MLYTALWAQMMQSDVLPKSVPKLGWTLGSVCEQADPRRILHCNLATTEPFSPASFNLATDSNTYYFVCHHTLVPTTSH